MISAGLPERIASPHSMVANQHVHDRVLEGVAHMQTSGHVRRWNHDAVGIAVTAGHKATSGFPGFVDGMFYLVRIVGFTERGQDQRSDCLIVWKRAEKKKPECSIQCKSSVLH